MGAIVLCANKLGAFCQLFYQVLFFCLSEQKPPTHFLTIRRRFETGFPVNLNGPKYAHLPKRSPRSRGYVFRWPKEHS